jgi:hypothetical protein
MSLFALHFTQYACVANVRRFARLNIRIAPRRPIFCFLTQKHQQSWARNGSWAEKSASARGKGAKFEAKCPAKLVPPHVGGGNRHHALLKAVPKSAYVTRKNGHFGSVFHTQPDYLQRISYQ